MNKLIIDATTGTVLNIENCYIVDSEVLGDNEYSDSELSAIAQNQGKSIMQVGRDTGWGDNAYRWTVSYSPLSLRDEARSYIEGGIYQEHEDEYPILKWASDTATTDELSELSDIIMGDDSLWDGFRQNFMSELKYFYKEKFENKSSDI